MAAVLECSTPVGAGSRWAVDRLLGLHSNHFAPGQREEGAQLLLDGFDRQIRRHDHPETRSADGRPGLQLLLAEDLSEPLLVLNTKHTLRVALLGVLRLGIPRYPRRLRRAHLPAKPTEKLLKFCLVKLFRLALENLGCREAVVTGVLLEQVGLRIREPEQERLAQGLAGEREPSDAAA